MDIESASGNWFADVIHHAYDDALCNMGIESADGVFLCAGALRGDTVYGPGKIHDVPGWRSNNIPLF